VNLSKSCFSIAEARRHVRHLARQGDSLVGVAAGTVAGQEEEKHHPVAAGTNKQYIAAEKRTTPPVLE
jgi:hypothetical protein